MREKLAEMVHVFFAFVMLRKSAAGQGSAAENYIIGAAGNELTFATDYPSVAFAKSATSTIASAFQVFGRFRAEFGVFPISEVKGRQMLWWV